MPSDDFLFPGDFCYQFKDLYRIKGMREFCEKTLREIEQLDRQEHDDIQANDFAFLCQMGITPDLEIYG
jgi:hypothetical protein